MSRIIYEVTCPGCSKRIHAPSLEKRQAAQVRHIRNCNVLKREPSLGLAPDSELVPQP